MYIYTLYKYVYIHKRFSCGVNEHVVAYLYTYSYTYIHKQTYMYILINIYMNMIYLPNRFSCGVNEHVVAVPIYTYIYIYKYM
jgi:hypothetical protein